MKIAFNMVSPSHAGGFSTYNYNIIKGLLNEQNCNYYLFINDNLVSFYELPVAKNINIIIVSNKYSNTIFRYLWMQIILPIHILRYNIEVLFSPMNIMPIVLKWFKTRTILVTHTNLPWISPQDVPGSKLWLGIQKLFLSLSIHIANKVIVDSNNAKKELVNFFPKIKNKTEAIYLGVDKNKFSKTENNIDFIHEKINIKKDNYFLTISSIVRYHCFIELITAYNNFCDECMNAPKLLLISNILDLNYYNEVKNLILCSNHSANIVLIDNINSELIPAIINNAYIYIFASYCEVFGFSNLEAMSCGLPVLTANKSAIPEICGDAALYFDPYDPGDIKNQMIELHFNDDLKNKLINKGYMQADKYSWERTCKQTKALIMNI